MDNKNAECCVPLLLKSNEIKQIRLMTKKMIILNASPRKNRNMATLLKEVQRGAEAASAEVEYIDLVSLNFKGCMSCFAC